MKLSADFWKISAFTMATMLLFALYEPLIPLSKHNIDKLVLAVNLPQITIPVSNRMYLDSFGAGFFAFVASWLVIKKDKTAINAMYCGGAYGYLYPAIGIVGILAPIVAGALLTVVLTEPSHDETTRKAAIICHERLAYAALGIGFICGAHTGFLIGAGVSVTAFGIVRGIKLGLLPQRQPQQEHV